MSLYYESSDFYDRNDYKHLIVCVKNGCSSVVLIKISIFKKFESNGSGLTFCINITPGDIVIHYTL